MESLLDNRGEKCGLEPVCRLAQEMKWILGAPDLGGDDLASLRLFCDAAARQAATVEQARALRHRLDRADHPLRVTASRRRLAP